MGPDPMIVLLERAKGEEYHIEPAVQELPDGKPIRLLPFVGYNVWKGPEETSEDPMIVVRVSGNSMRPGRDIGALGALRPSADAGDIGLFLAEYSRLSPGLRTRCDVSVVEGNHNSPMTLSAKPFFHIRFEPGAEHESRYENRAVGVYVPESEERPLTVEDLLRVRSPPHPGRMVIRDALAALAQVEERYGTSIEHEVPHEEMSRVVQNLPGIGTVAFDVRSGFRHAVSGPALDYSIGGRGADEQATRWNSMDVEGAMDVVMRRFRTQLE